MREFIIYFKIAFCQRIAKKNIKMNIPGKRSVILPKRRSPALVLPQTH